MKKGLVQDGVILTTLTACCEECKDLFTVWAKVKNNQVLVEPQYRLRHRNGSRVDSDGYIPIPHEGFFHHCGGRLALYPNYILDKVIV